MQDHAKIEVDLKGCASSTRELQLDKSYTRKMGKSSNMQDMEQAGENGKRKIIVFACDK